MATIDKTFFERLGGLKTLEQVHKIFYDKLYADQWVRLYFTDKPQHVLEEQQTDFMAQIFGGPKRYAGKSPKMAHQHMNITEELFRLRQTLLNESLKEYGLADDLRKEWMEADANFKRALVKESVDECKRSNPSQAILDFEKPN